MEKAERFLSHIQMLHHSVLRNTLFTDADALVLLMFLPCTWTLGSSNVVGVFSSFLLNVQLYVCPSLLCQNSMVELFGAGRYHCIFSPPFLVHLNFGVCSLLGDALVAFETIFMERLLSEPSQRTNQCCHEQANGVLVRREVYHVK